MQFSTRVRNARANAVESTIGASPLLYLYASGGALPANPAAAATGTLIATGTLPADWMNAAASGTKTKLGTWGATGLAAASIGTDADYFRVMDPTGAACDVQGTIGVTGSTGFDAYMDDVNIASGQSTVVNVFTINEGNA